jgi:hypothetical protein
MTLVFTHSDARRAELALAQRVNYQAPPPASRPLRPDERMLFPAEADRVYRRGRGWFLARVKAKLIPAQDSSRAGKPCHLIHPDDAMRAARELQ